MSEKRMRIIIDVPGNALDYEEKVVTLPNIPETCIPIIRAIVYAYRTKERYPDTKERLWTHSDGKHLVRKTKTGYSVKEVGGE